MSNFFLLLADIGEGGTAGTGVGGSTANNAGSELATTSLYTYSGSSVQQGTNLSVASWLQAATSSNPGGHS